MSFSYNENLPRLLDHIRLALNQRAVTDASAVAGTVSPDFAPAYYSDEEINAKVSSVGYLEGLAQLADGLKTQYIGQAQKTTDDDVSYDFGERVKHFADLADAARSGRIRAPGTSRPGISVGLISAGLQTDSLTPPATGTGPNMAGFRSD